MLNLNQSLYFWRTRDGSEVDLVVKDSKGLKAFEVKWSAKKGSARGSFQDKYKTVPVLINKENFAQFLLS